MYKSKLMLEQENVIRVTGKLFKLTGILVLFGLLVGCSSTKVGRITEEHRQAVKKAEQALQQAWGTPGQEYAARLNRPELKKFREAIKNNHDFIIQPGSEWLYNDLKESTKKALLGVKWPLPPVAKVPFTSAPIKFDGKLDEDAWKTALTYKGAYPFNTKDYTATPQTVWKLLWDEHYLYVAYLCEDENILAEKRQRDDAVYSDDCVEIFILPEFRFRTYWELMINPYGSIYDSVQCKNIDQWGCTQDLSQNIEGLKFGIDIQGTINKSDDKDIGYSVELAIPFSQLPGFSRLKPKAGDKLHFTLVRLDKKNKKTMVPLSYQPLLGWGHNIWNHATMELEIKQ